MHHQDEGQVFAVGECVESYDDKAKADAEAEGRRHESGNNSKKLYRSPVLTVFGSLSDFIEIDVNPYKNWDTTTSSLD
jgi:hypothetical protein